MSILEKILAWAINQEDWKQDAIRRIIEQESYTNDDVSEIANILLHQNGYVDSAPSPTLIDRSRFYSNEKTAINKIVLKKIESLKNINALSQEGKLKFAFSGLTIIYGENGVGKSGYVRILKKCCKAKGFEKILPDVFTKESSQITEATIFYSCNGDEKKLKWIDDQYDGSELEQLVVYDNKCGKIQVTDKNELIYLPNGADIFKKLIDCLKEVKKEIQNKQPQSTSINEDKIHQNTNAFNIIKSITKDTEKEKIANDLEWTNKHHDKLSKVSQKILDANEEGIRRQVNTVIKEIKNFKSIKITVVDLEKKIFKDKVANIFRMKRVKNEQQLALDMLTENMQKEKMLEGTGNELWRIMYDAAKEFSIKSVYKSSDYPNLDGQCVLCQQELDSNAKKKMADFSDFAKGLESPKFSI